MEAYRIDSFGSVDGILLRSSEDPRPGLREVLIRVRATSLNYRDLMVLKGGGRGPTKLGVVPLSDDAGEVAAIGDGVTRVKVGDRIALTAPAYSERRSTLANKLRLGRKPIALAATSPTPALTDAKARRTRKSRPASNSEGVATETAARPTRQEEAITCSGCVGIRLAGELSPISLLIPDEVGH